MPDTESPISQPPIQHIEFNPSAPSFDFDDAFSDGEEHDTIQYVFSPDAVRADMASLGYDWDEPGNTTAGSNGGLGELELANNSVSTMALDHSYSQSSLASSSPSISFNDLEFSQISLSEDAQAEETFTEQPKEEEEEEDEHSQQSIHVPASGASTTPPISSPPSAHTQTPPVNGNKTPPSPMEVASNDSRSTTDINEIASNNIPSASSPTLPNFKTGSLSQPSSSSVPTFNNNITSIAGPVVIPTKPSRHRPTRSVGPSTFEKVMSKTRPSFLPPKQKWEDNKHMSDWETMMRQSRATAEKRRKALEERRKTREQKIEDSVVQWEKEIVPDWKIVFKNAALRHLWWAGIPTKLRATMWEQAVGNPLSLSKDTYRTCLARAKRALAAGTFPTTTLGLLEEDIDRTLPALHIFNRDNGPLYADLKDMICAWVVSRSDEGLGYTSGLAKIAAMLLINMSPQRGFILLRNLLERHCMRSFYGGMGTKDDVEAYYRIFDTLLADGMPKIYFNFKQHQISPSLYLNDWILPLFMDHLPFEACTRIWDVFMLEGDAFIYRASLGLLAVLEPRLFFPEQKELIELLKGENKAAIDVAKREGRPLDGGRYEIYGVDEETLWERIDSMKDWWKESTWTRLIQRELPDI